MDNDDDEEAQQALVPKADPNGYARGQHEEEEIVEEVYEEVYEEVVEEEVVEVGAASQQQVSVSL